LKCRPITILLRRDARKSRKSLFLAKPHRESGRRQPEAVARALLIVIAADPEFVMRSLAKNA
jgi:hypothetical protein